MVDHNESDLNTAQESIHYPAPELRGGKIIFVVVFAGLNRTSVYRKEVFRKCVAKRQQNRPMITVSNHYSMIDDFLVSRKYICTFSTL